MLILTSCQSDNVKKLSDLDLDQLVELRVIIHDSTLSFKDLNSGFYFFVAKSCSACVDHDLAKIDTYNQNNDPKVYVIVNDPLAKNRIGHFLKYSNVFIKETKVSDNNVLVKKTNNVISISRIEEIQ
jgi:hypothetical protein